MQFDKLLSRLDTSRDIVSEIIDGIYEGDANVALETIWHDIDDAYTAIDIQQDKILDMENYI